MRVYIDEVIRGLEAGRVKSFSQERPEMQSDGHYMNFIVHYTDKNEPVSYPLPREEFEELERFMESRARTAIS